MSILSNISYAITCMHCCFSSNIISCCATCFAQIEVQILLRLSINAHRKQSFFVFQGLPLSLYSKWESTIIYGRPQKFFQGGQRRQFVDHFQIADDQCPSKIILHWGSICFSEHDYFRAEQLASAMDYKLCELYNKYTILSKHKQNTQFIQKASCLRAFILLWNVASAQEWDFTAQQFWWSWVFALLRRNRRNIADDTMQMDIHTTLYPFYTTEKMPHVTVTITKTLRCQQ